MHYKNGFAFERLLLGHHSPNTEKSFGYRSFGDSITPLISEARRGGYLYPDTKIAKSLYFGVGAQLEKRGICSSGLMFVPSVKTGLDQYHETDSFFFLPPIPDFPITIDLFNIDTEISKILHDAWEVNYEYYPEEVFQFDLFLHKKGLASFMRETGADTTSGWTKVFKPDSNLWSYPKMVKTKKINHFILIPEYTTNRARRGRFCKMVAETFEKEIRRKEKIKFGPVGQV